MFSAPAVGVFCSQVKTWSPARNMTGELLSKGKCLLCIIHNALRSCSIFSSQCNFQSHNICVIFWYWSTGLSSNKLKVKPKIYLVHPRVVLPLIISIAVLSQLWLLHRSSRFGRITVFWVVNKIAPRCARKMHNHVTSTLLQIWTLQQLPSALHITPLSQIFRSGRFSRSCTLIQHVFGKLSQAPISF